MQLVFSNKHDTGISIVDVVHLTYQALEGFLTDNFLQLLQTCKNLRLFLLHTFFQGRERYSHNSGITSQDIILLAFARYY